MFRNNKTSLDSLPPTQDALHLHIRRSHYQTFIWKKAIEPRPLLPSPQSNGWIIDDGDLKPQLMTKEPVSAACLQLAFCGCSKEGSCCATRRCTCARLQLLCSKACKCNIGFVVTSLIISKALLKNVMCILFNEKHKLK